MIIKHQLLRDCSHQTAAECSDAVLAALGHGPDLALKTGAIDNAVHGSVTISHGKPPVPHDVMVEIYEQDKPGIVRAGRTPVALRRPVRMLTEQECRTKLDTVKDP